jgi:hypothetical protein
MRENRKNRNQKRLRLFFLRAQVPEHAHAPLFRITLDSKTGGQPWISVDGDRNSIGLWSGWKTSVDLERRGVPKGGLGTMNVPVVLFDQIFRLAILLI